MKFCICVHFNHIIWRKNGESANHSCLYTGSGSGWASCLKEKAPLGSNLRLVWVLLTGAAVGVCGLGARGSFQNTRVSLYLWNASPFWAVCVNVLFRCRHMHEWVQWNTWETSSSRVWCPPGALRRERFWIYCWFNMWRWWKRRVPF